VRWIAWGAIVAHVAVAIFLNSEVGIWVDEYFSLDTSGHGLDRALQQALHFELQPPFYFLLLSLWLDVNSSPFWGRLFSLLWSLAALYVSLGLAKRWLSGIDPHWFVVALAVNPYLLWTSTELRLYSLAVFLSALLLLLLHDGFFEEGASRWKRWLYGLVSAIALYTQYYLGFLLVANAAALLVTRRYRALGQYVVIMAATALAFAPMVPVVFEQIFAHSGTIADLPTPLRSVWIIAHHLQEMVFPLYQLGTWRWMAMMLALGLAAVAAMVAGRRSIGEKQVALWTSLAVAFVIYVLTVFVSGPEVVNRTHTAGLLPIGSLVPFSIIALLAGRPRQWALGAWVLLLAGLSFQSIYFINEPMAKHGASKQTAEFIMNHEEADQPILIFPGKMELPFSVYYKGINAVVPLPRPSVLEKAGLHDDVLTSEDDIARALASVPGEHRRLWVVTTMSPERDEYLGVKYNSALILSYLRKHYRMLRSEKYVGAEMLYLKKK